MARVLFGDCLKVLKEFDNPFAELVYLDPPFFTQKNHILSTRDLQQQFQFTDKWKNIQEYTDYLRTRLIEIKRVMKDSACIFVHCDTNASHHLRVLMDEIFGSNQFVSEIIWAYRRWSNSSRKLLPAHQTIFMYSKTDAYTFNVVLQDYSETTNLDQILQKRERNAFNKTVYAKERNGEIVLNGPKLGVPLSDVWEIPYLNPKAKERTGYPTQKPILLMERIIKLCSNPGDTILDPFCGSGTTLVAAKLLDRDYVGIDISEDAVQLSKTRLEIPTKSNSLLLEKGRIAYDNLPESVKGTIAALPVKPVQRNSGIDAIYDEFIDQRPVVIRVQREGENLVDAAKSLAKAGRKKKASVMLLIQTSPETTTTLIDVFPADIIVVKSTEFQIKEAIESCLTKLHSTNHY